MKNCADVRELLPALVADNVTDEQRAEVETHLSECGTCVVALENLRQVASVLIHAPMGPEPEPDLERHVFTLVRHDDVARLAKEAPLLPEPPPELEDRSISRAGVLIKKEKRGLWPRVSLVLTPAFGLAAVLLAVLLIADNGPGSSQSPLARPSGQFMQEIRLTGAGEADLSLTHFRQDNYRLTLTDTDQLPPLTEGHHYELWLKGEDGLVSAGNFRYVEREDFPIDFNVGVDPSDYKSVEITEEPDDGDPEKSGDSVCEGQFDTAGLEEF